MQSKVNSTTDAVRTYSYLPSIIKTLFTKKREKTLKKMKLHETKFAPFKVLENEKTFQVVLGNAIMSTKKFKSKKQAEEFLATKPYDLIINAACYCMEQNIKMKENEKNNDSNNNTANA